MDFISFPQYLPSISRGLNYSRGGGIYLGRHQHNEQRTVRKKDGLEQLYLFDVYQEMALRQFPNISPLGRPRGGPTMAQSRFASKDLDFVHLTASSSTSPTKTSKPERVLAYASRTTPTLFYAAPAALSLFASSSRPLLPRMARELLAGTSKDKRLGQTALRVGARVDKVGVVERQLDGAIDDVVDGLDAEHE